MYKELDPVLPLRVTPLEIFPFTPVLSRLDPWRQVGIQNQYAVVQCWLEELDRRFTVSERELPINELKFFTRA